MTTEIKCTHVSVDETRVRRKYQDITLRLIEMKLQITTMESCTSGLIASLITDTEGSSAVLKGAFVTYSNEAKIRVELIGSDNEVIAKHGIAIQGKVAQEDADQTRELLADWLDTYIMETP